MNQGWEGRLLLLRRWWRIPTTLLLLVVIGIGMHVAKVGADGAAPQREGQAAQAALFIGDSYTEGSSTPDLSYACISATKLGWKCDIAAQPGTGYLNGGQGHRLQLGAYIGPSTSMVERLLPLRERYPADIVVLDGGRNDLDFGMADVVSTFSRTLTQVIELWPDSRVVVIAPWFVKEPVIRPPALHGRTIGAELRAVLDSSPAFGDVDLIDPGALGWFVGTDVSPYLSDDGIHPNPAGNQRIADLLTAALISETGTRSS